MSQNRSASAFAIAGALALGLLLPMLPTPAHAVRSGDMVCNSKTASSVVDAVTGEAVNVNAIFEGDALKITYTIVVQNTGTLTLNNVTITDTLPAGAVFFSAIDPAGGSHTNVPAGVVTFTIPSVSHTNPISMSLTITITAAVPSIFNTASVTHATDTAPSICNNTIPVEPVIELLPRLVCLAKDVDKSTVAEGVDTDLTYTMAIQYINENLLPPPATGVTVTDTFGDAGANGVEFVSAAVSPVGAISCVKDPGPGETPLVAGDVLIDGQSFRCSIPDMIPDATGVATSTVTAVFTAVNPVLNTSYTNQAQGAATAPDVVTGTVAACAETVTVTEVPAVGCRVTGGGNASAGATAEGLWDGTFANDKTARTTLGVNEYTFGGQAGANTGQQPQPKGEWTHRQHKGPDGEFTFHAGTASAPIFTEIDRIICSDPGYCDPARPAPAKQIDFVGVGSFKNVIKIGTTGWLSAVVIGVSEHWFEVHIEDLGEPGATPRGWQTSGNCPAAGHAGLIGGQAICDCPDFYSITIHANADPNSFVVYNVYGYIDGGNFQIHPPTGFDN